MSDLDLVVDAAGRATVDLGDLVVVASARMRSALDFVHIDALTVIRHDVRAADLRAVPVGRISQQLQERDVRVRLWDAYRRRMLP